MAISKFLKTYNTHKHILNILSSLKDLIRFLIKNLNDKNIEYNWKEKLFLYYSKRKKFKRSGPFKET